MTELQNQVKQNYIGNIVELFKIDASSFGGAVHYLTPSGLNVSFGGINYTPFPIQMSNKTYDAESAPSRPTLSISAKPGTIFYQLVIAYGDLVGAEVEYKKTLSRFLDDGEDPNPLEHFPVERFKIIQRSSLSAAGITFVLATPLDQPLLQLPRRQILRDDVGGQHALYAPGVSRVRRV